MPVFSSKENAIGHIRIYHGEDGLEHMSLDALEKRHDADHTWGRADHPGDDPSDGPHDLRDLLRF